MPKSKTKEQTEAPSEETVESTSGADEKTQKESEVKTTDVEPEVKKDETVADGSEQPAEEKQTATQPDDKA